jgi:hypothetical protein
MSTLKVALWRRQNEEITAGRWGRGQNYFDLHPLAEVVRGLVYTSVLWGLLAVGVYSIYSIVLGTF